MSTESNKNDHEPLFSDIKKTVENDSPITEVESLCMNCHKNVNYLFKSFIKHSLNLKIKGDYQTYFNKNTIL